MRQWLARRPDLDDVFRRMIDIDGGMGCWFKGDRSTNGWIRSSVGPGIPVSRSAASVLRDLQDRGLLRIRRYVGGDAHYELPIEAREFEHWRLGLPTPVDEMEDTTLLVVDDARFEDPHRAPPGT